MNGIRLIWPPAPCRAGFAVTDDTDSATLAQVRAVYDFLDAQRFLTTKTVWPYRPEEATGVPPMPEWTQWGVTLEDPEYRAYCMSLARKGFEICLHGASAGNNRRERIARAFEDYRELFPSSPVYICHSKNADNPYWGRQVTTLEPFRTLTRIASRHAYSGAVEGSPYYWGDLCREHVEYIRLYRTRRVDTLAANPSMPYRNDSTPAVRGWFSATRRRLADCAAPAELAALKRGFGCTILYQYLHRYAHPVTHELDAAFTDAVRRLASDPEILVAPAGTLLWRLRAMQGVFLVRDGDDLHALNSNSYTVEDVQVAMGPGFTAVERIGTIAGASSVALPGFRGFRARGRNVLSLDGSGRATRAIGHAVLTVERSGMARGDAARSGMADGAPPLFCTVTPAQDSRTPHATLPVWEEYRLLFGQMLIIGRDRARRFLGSGKKQAVVVDGIPHWNHNGW